MYSDELINVQQLSKSYRVADKRPGVKGTLRHFFNRKTIEVEAVKSINFTISPGEIVGFLGGNGAGKTTILKMLCGLIYPTSGLVEVAGFIPQKRQLDFLKNITLVMGQKQQLLWDLPPLDSLQVNASVYGLTDMEANQRIYSLAEMLDIGDELTRPVRKLSLGQRMKAELLASLIHRPSILFLDEPTLGLDVNAQSNVRSFLAEYNRKTGATILLTSHYMADITALCPRVICIHKGQIFYDGELDSLTNRLCPEREIYVEFRTNVLPAQFVHIGKIHDLKDRSIRLLVPRADLTKAITYLLNNFEVIDLQINDPPIENLIGDLFIKGRI